LFEKWSRMVVARCGVAPRECYSGPTLGCLSMWTDNGAAYWYRKEAGMGGIDVDGTLVRRVEGLREERVPVRCVQLDSWCYEHGVRREISEIGYLSIVPPTGMIQW
jgi:hypothetical protein